MARIDGVNVRRLPKKREMSYPVTSYHISALPIEEQVRLMSVPPYRLTPTTVTAPRKAGRR